MLIKPHIKKNPGGYTVYHSEILYGGDGYYFSEGTVAFADYRSYRKAKIHLQSVKDFCIEHGLKYDS